MEISAKKLSLILFLVMTVPTGLWLGGVVFAGNIIGAFIAGFILGTITNALCRLITGEFPFGVFD